MTDPTLLQNAVAEAKRAWVGCAWRTRFGPAEMDLFGLRARQAALAARATRGQESQNWLEAARWLAMVERDAASAAEFADSALAAAARNDFARAYRQLTEALRLEQKYRVPVAYGPALELCDQLATGQPCLA